jgi:hypothetical protein
MIRLFLAVIPWLGLTPGWAEEKNGFDLSEALIPANQIFHGGPGKDGIPAIHAPKFVTARQADWLQSEDRVLGLELGGIAKAYPVPILNWHEIVNDKMGDQAVVISYCPLCGTGMAFSAQVKDRTLRFGVSGLLYNSDVLLYDLETGSLWSQLMRQAIAGAFQGTELTLLALEHTSWDRWRQNHPETLVLSLDTGYSRDYRKDPYRGYENSEGLYFPVSRLDPRYHPKQWTLGLELAGQFKAYPFVELDRAGGRVQDSLAGKKFIVIYDQHDQSARIEDLAGNAIPTVRTFWFAWMAFHPDTAVYQAPRD